MSILLALFLGQGGFVLPLLHFLMSLGLVLRMRFRIASPRSVSPLGGSFFISDFIMADPQLPITEDIPEEFAQAIPLEKPHRRMITSEGTVYFGLLGRDGINRYFMCDPDVMGHIALECMALASSAQNIAGPRPELGALQFETTDVITTSTMGPGAIEFTFLTPDRTALSTLIQPELAAEMAASLFHVLETMPKPPRIPNLITLQAALKGTPHPGKDTETYFGQTYRTDILQILGVLIIRANILEDALTELLAAIADISKDKAEAFFYSSINNKARIDMIESQVNVSDLPDYLRTKVYKPC